jgi:hypothetical protein
VKKFINLTNGLAWGHLVAPDGYVRIQSTYLEQKHFSKVIEDLDYTFLLPLVSGEECVVLDASHRSGGVSRAIYQGLPWIKYVVELRCKGLESQDIRVKGNNVAPYFKEQAARLSSRAKVKLAYAKKFAKLDQDPLRLSGRGLKTIHDGDYDHFVEIYHAM